jgi:hypothetical protein
MPGSWRDRPVAAPAFGGTLNATVAKVDESEPRTDAASDTILSHNPLPGAPPQFDQPAPAEPAQPTPVADSLTEAIKSEPESQLSYEPIPEPHEQPPAATPTLSELEAQAQASAAATVPPGGIDDARAAVDAALNAMPFNPAGQPLQSVGAQPLGEEIRPAEPSLVIPAEQAPAEVAPQPTQPLAAEPLSVPPPPAPAPSLPPLPDFSTLPPMPGQEQQPPHPAMTDPTLAQDATVTVPTDPGQFQIPGAK